jgi:hypothetical protein
MFATYLGGRLESGVHGDNVVALDSRGATVDGSGVLGHEFRIADNLFAQVPS